MTQSERDTAKLVVDASARGDLSADSLNALQSVPGVTRQIEQSLGSSDLAEITDVLLLSILVDDSQSIGWAKNTNVVIRGHNRIVQVIMEAGVMSHVLLHTKLLNDRVVNAYRPLASAVPLGPENYREEQFGGTPLFRQSVVLLGSVAAKTQELEARGKTARSITLIITDGDDQHSEGTTAGHVRWLATDMRKSNRHIIAGMGVEDGSTNYRQIFRDMGIPDKRHLTPSAGEDKIIKAFQDFGQEAAKASLDPASFERLALGSGFSS